MGRRRRALGTNRVVGKGQFAAGTSFGYLEVLDAVAAENSSQKVNLFEDFPGRLDIGGLCPRIRLEESSRLSCADPRRSGRVAEGGALLRRYGGECLHRGFESLLLRFLARRGVRVA